MVVGGPHESSDGRAVTIEEREIGMLQAEVFVKLNMGDRGQKFVDHSANHRRFINRARPPPRAMRILRSRDP